MKELNKKQVLVLFEVLVVLWGSIVLNKKRWMRRRLRQLPLCIPFVSAIQEVGGHQELQRYFGRNRKVRYFC
jgi:hypothetical protein